MLVAVSTSALRASSGILSGPAAFLFFSIFIAFLISAFFGLLHLIGSYESAGGMLAGSVGGGEAGGGRFNSY